MNSASLIAVLESTSGLIVLALLYFWLVPSLRLDLFRQQLFEVRDELFDYARAGKISFEHPAYKLLRRSANGFIRYAHRLTFFRIAMTVLVWKLFREHPEPKWVKQWLHAMDSLDATVQADLSKFHERILSLVLKRLVFGSPILIAVLFGVAMGTVCKAGIKAGMKSIRKSVKTSAKDAVATVIDPELLEEEASRAAHASA